MTKMADVEEEVISAKIPVLCDLTNNNRNLVGVEEKGVPTARSRGVFFEASTGGNESETGPAKLLYLLIPS